MLYIYCLFSLLSLTFYVFHKPRKYDPMAYEPDDDEPVHETPTYDKPFNETPVSEKPVNEKLETKPVNILYIINLYIQGVSNILALILT